VVLGLGGVLAGWRLGMARSISHSSLLTSPRENFAAGMAWAGRRSEALKTALPTSARLPHAHTISYSHSPVCSCAASFCSYSWSWSIAGHQGFRVRYYTNTTAMTYGRATRERSTPTDDLEPVERMSEGAHDMCAKEKSRDSPVGAAGSLRQGGATCCVLFLLRISRRCFRGG